MNWKFWKKERIKLPDRDIDDLKRIVKILFIDDRVFGNVQIIKNAGWVNTTQIKDADSLDQTEIRNAHILFVDIQGVGKRLKFSEEGLGLIMALKERYPNKKVIVYSGEDQGKIEAFHPGIDKADARLAKNADPYQFQTLIEKYAVEAFGLSECVNRIQKIIMDEFGQSLTTDQITANIEKIYTKKDYSIQGISKIFNLSNAGSLADVISIFLTG